MAIGSGYVIWLCSSRRVIDEYFISSGADSEFERLQATFACTDERFPFLAFGANRPNKPAAHISVILKPLLDPRPNCSQLSVALERLPSKCSTGKGKGKGLLKGGRD